MLHLSDRGYGPSRLRFLTVFLLALQLVSILNAGIFFIVLLIFFEQRIVLVGCALQTQQRCAERPAV